MIRTANHFAPILVAFGILGLTTTLPSCATMGATEPVATLVIENDSPMQVNIHALRNGSRIRIGAVPGVTTREFPLRRDMITAGGELRLVIDPVGSTRTYPAMPIHVREGDVIDLRVSALIR